MTAMKIEMLLVASLAGLLGTPQTRPPAPVIDYHQHLFSPAAVANSGTGRPTVSAKELVTLLDAAGIRKALVLSLAYQYGNPNRPAVENEYEKVRTENDWTSEQVGLYPDRLVGFCSINPLKEYALEEIARCGKDERLRRGLKLHFGNSDVDLSKPDHVARLKQVFALANRQRMAIVVHMRASVTMKRAYGASRARVFLDEVLPAAPDVPVQIAHLGGAGGYNDPGADEVMGVFIDAIAKKDPRVRKLYFDVSGVAGLGDWRPRAAVIAARLAAVGVERVLYGTDGAGGPSPTPEQGWATFRELPLTDAEFRTIAANVAPYMK
jgi:predicted TIM-barrel fold metal-dependent hydrolase